MRVLVVGTYPPARTPAADENVDGVARLLGEGHEVEVLSPRPSAAHQHGSMRGPRGALRLARRSRPFDALVLRCEPGMLLRPGANHLERLATCLAFGLVVRLGPRTTVQVDDLGGRSSLDLRWGPLLWRHAHRVVVASEHHRQLLTGEGGVPGERVELRRRPRRHQPEMVGWGQGDGPSREAAMAAVRARAAGDRRASVAVEVDAWGWPLHPEPEVPVPSLPRRAVRLAKRLRRLLLRVLGATVGRRP